jgi:hypothetical protein
MQVSFKNPKTGEMKRVKVGWSWTLFFFSGVFGLPLFLRKLYIWGFVFLALWAVNLLVSSSTSENADAAKVFMFFVGLGLAVWLGVKGNEMTAKNYLEQGWTFAEPQSDAVKFAQGKWGIFIDNSGSTAPAT